MPSRQPLDGLNLTSLLNTMNTTESPPEIEGHWAISSDGENYGGSTFPTKEEAIAAGKDLYEGASFYLGQIRKPIPPEHFFSADIWLEHVSVQEDYSGEHAEDWDGSTKEEREELETEVRKVMAAWLDKYDLRPTFWNVDEKDKIGED